jgi:small subunit ribosomal protein S11
MALRVLRASSSSSNLSRQSWRGFSTSIPRYQGPNLHNTTTTTTTLTEDIENDPEDNDNDNIEVDDGPPTSNVYSRPRPTTNPLRRTLTLSKHIETFPYQIHVTCTRNNTHILIHNERGQPLRNARWTGGSCGFKGVHRSGYEAGYQCAVRAFARVRQLAREGEAPGARFEVRFSGFGQGREAVVKALMTSEGDDVRPFVSRVTDCTPIKIGGTRAKKTRRL